MPPPSRRSGPSSRPCRYELGSLSVPPPSLAHALGESRTIIVYMVVLTTNYTTEPFCCRARAAAHSWKARPPSPHRLSFAVAVAFSPIPLSRSRALGGGRGNPRIVLFFHSHIGYNSIALSDS